MINPSGTKFLQLTINFFIFTIQMHDILNIIYLRISSTKKTLFVLSMKRAVTGQYAIFYAELEKSMEVLIN